jgi:hypothetical protein
LLAICRASGVYLSLAGWSSAGTPATMGRRCSPSRLFVQCTTTCRHWPVPLHLPEGCRCPGRAACVQPEGRMIVMVTNPKPAWRPHHDGGLALRPEGPGHHHDAAAMPGSLARVTIAVRLRAECSWLRAHAVARDGSIDRESHPTAALRGVHKKPWVIRSTLHFRTTIVPYSDEGVIFARYSSKSSTYISRLCLFQGRLRPAKALLFAAGRYRRCKAPTTVSHLQPETIPFFEEQP